VVLAPADADARFANVCTFVEHGGLGDDACAAIISLVRSVLSLNMNTSDNDLATSAAQEHLDRPERSTVRKVVVERHAGSVEPQCDRGPPRTFQ